MSLVAVWPCAGAGAASLGRRTCRLQAWPRRHARSEACCSVGVQQDESKHYRARCYRPFVYERATKVEAVRLGLLNANGQVTGETHKNFHLLPEGSACKMCGKERTSSEHSTICLHPLWSLIDASIQSGSLHTDLHSLLSHEAARSLYPRRKKKIQR